ncbi:MAG: sigma-70 family RNA polymerase sigma factor, partial [Solirubrobacteraceae bacterium]
MSPGIPTRLLATQSDDRLLALVRQGHERAFEAIVHRYRKPLLGYCRRLRLEDARAEDIVQLALLKTWIAVREGSEVRDLKAWLYRVVHNTAVNALRDSAHDGQPLPDPTLSSTLESRTDDSQLERGMAMREALAEVAALPPLQREVIVRTAVAGDSHEQVASDLGITNGAVRGLLYRARTTLRTGVTALTPPPLLGWLAGRSNRGGPAPERLAELAGGGGAAVGVGGAGAAGVSGLLLKGGAVALTVGTVITGAAVVHLSASTPHHRHRLIASAAPQSNAGAGSTRFVSRSAARYGELSAAAAGAGARHGAAERRDGRGSGSAGGKSRGAPSTAGGGGSAGASPVSAGNHTPRSTTRVSGGAHGEAPVKAPAGQSPVVSSPQGSSQAGAGAGPGGGAGQSGGSGEAGSGSGTDSGWRPCGPVSSKESSSEKVPIGRGRRCLRRRRKPSPMASAEQKSPNARASSRSWPEVPPPGERSSTVLEPELVAGGQ